MKVYLIESNINGTCTYKIGKTSRSVSTRLSELNTGNAGQLRIISEYESENAGQIELALHSRYGHKRLAGEWFSDDITAQDFINSCKEIDENIKKLKEMGNPFL